MQETLVPSLGWEGPLEEGMATHSSIPAWRIPWTEQPGGLQSMGSHRVSQSKGLTHIPTHYTSPHTEGIVVDIHFPLYKKLKSQLPPHTDSSGSSFSDSILIFYFHPRHLWG